MQFHYVVGYDTEMKHWFVELDTAAYFYDGHVWSPADTPYGWRVPEESSEEEVLDQALLNTLSYIVDTFPIPKEHENVIA